MQDLFVHCIVRFNIKPTHCPNSTFIVPKFKQTWAFKGMPRGFSIMFVYYKILTLCLLWCRILVLIYKQWVWVHSMCWVSFVKSVKLTYLEIQSNILYTFRNCNIHDAVPGWFPREQFAPTFLTPDRLPQTVTTQNSYIFWGWKKLSKGWFSQVGIPGNCFGG